jgi:uncharacterized iron-regulated protein
MLIAGAAVLAAPFASAELPQADLDADIVFLGEVHDNPAHHTRQAEWVRDLAPVALVFEMLPPDLDNTAISAAVDDIETLEAVLGWRNRGWPDFAMYYPIFAAAPDAAIYGAALPRDQARALAATPLAEAFGPDAARFGLDRPLSSGQQQMREALQLSAHCDAMPEEMLPMMVNIQRLRDATLASAALSAFTERGGPVAVITGNGHARTDWGAPAALAQAAPGLRIYALGQSEDGIPPEGRFDLVLDAKGVARPDPCEAFR